MEIVIKYIENEEFDSIIYLRTEDGVNISAEFATGNNQSEIIKKLKNDNGITRQIPIKVDVSNFDLEKANRELMEKNQKENKIPLVLVFYLDRGLMETPDIINNFAEAVNNTIAKREANAMAFFLPTDGDERIECINPQLATPKEKSRITKMIDEIEKQFDINQNGK